MIGTYRLLISAPATRTHTAAAAGERIHIHVTACQSDTPLRHAIRSRRMIDKRERIRVAAIAPCRNMLIIDQYHQPAFHHPTVLSRRSIAV